MLGTARPMMSNLSARVRTAGRRWRFGECRRYPLLPTTRWWPYFPFEGLEVLEEMDFALSVPLFVAERLLLSGEPKLPRRVRRFCTLIAYIKQSSLNVSSQHIPHLNWREFIELLNLIFKFQHEGEPLELSAYLNLNELNISKCQYSTQNLIIRWNSI